MKECQKGFDYRSGFQAVPTYSLTFQSSKYLRKIKEIIASVPAYEMLKKLFLTNTPG